MQAEVKDEQNYTEQALRSIGMRISAKDLELILNVHDLVSEKGMATELRDVREMKMCVNALFGAEDLLQT